MGRDIRITFAESAINDLEAVLAYYPIFVTPHAQQGPFGGNRTGKWLKDRGIGG